MLKIKRPIYEAMLRHLQAAYPLEACGLLAGQSDLAIHHYAIDNILQSPVAYEMEPLQQLKAMLEMDERGWMLLAIYHSHPCGPQTPSPTDIAKAFYPEAYQAIVSLQEWAQPVARAFTIANGRVDEVPLIVV